jgi:c-di-GMP-binding flagellar brake protein YcgR
MKKEITICFRTNEELRGALEAVARDDHRSLSSAIELILTDYLKKNRDFPTREQQEKRRYQRKRISIPAYVKAHETDTTQHGAVILDVSLGGICLSVPKECVTQIYEAGEKSQFETSFVLPESNKSVHFICKTERVVPSNGNAYMGASFVDAEFSNYQQLQQYLM